MMVAPSFDQTVRKHYPDAITELEFAQRIGSMLEQQSLDPARTLLATSICADDIVPMRESETPLTKNKAKLKKELLGPFSMGGLAGLPYSGLTGILTVAHHVPDGGSVLFAYGPHIGISNAGELGRLHRPGQCRESVACGALSLALKHFQGTPEHRAEDEDDTEQVTLERRLHPFRERILAAEHPLKEATEIAYTLIHDLVHRYVRTQKAQFGCEYIAFAGGIVINTGPDWEDYVDLRHLSVFPVADL